MEVGTIHFFGQHKNRYAKSEYNHESLNLHPILVGYKEKNESIGKAMKNRCTLSTDPPIPSVSISLGSYRSVFW